MKDSKEMAKIYKWCWSHGIKVYPIPLDSYGGLAKICIEKKNEKTIGNIVYNQKNDLYEKINNIYIHIFKKNQKNNEKT